MSVVVVTDTSARLPADTRNRWAIREVPLHILLDGADLRDGVDEMPDDIYQRHATTAAATPAELAAAYRQALADSNGNGVVAVHISSALSGTHRAAEMTAAELGPAVRVVDSKSAAMGTGFAVLAAARAAADGQDLDTVAHAAEEAARRTYAFMVVPRLDNLRRSGRIGGAKAWLGTALSLKPVLRIDDTGRLVLAQRVRTVKHAVAAMVERVCEIVGGRRAAVAVHHVANPDGAQEVATALAQRLPACEPATVTPLGPVLALHVGAGALAVCLHCIE
ncbi:fatty acid-binding protein DegV [Mycobacterium kansasii]|uniref:DegV family protein n=1 Tax=Mycobacterium attenuatum TaxID=2341086 RepID=UPI000A09938E|nr:DegV family protein [Mycobacterium attenuatum]ORB83202.1 fatty acid-binding protein DegV [Mycobacterium kansasii]VBA56536.1 DegV domain-containing protein [Mycobacterium attenuatum]VBA60038.1 DegV domain-containing protein [Mycobacterium attenuatum]